MMKETTNGTTLSTNQGTILGIAETFSPSTGWTKPTRSQPVREILKAAADDGCTHVNLKIDKGTHISYLDYGIPELLGAIVETRSNWDSLGEIYANQASRPANLVAIDRRTFLGRGGKRQLALYEYAMPAGSTSLVAVSSDPNVPDKNVNYRTLPKFWFALIRDQDDSPGLSEGNMGILCGQSQGGKVYAFPETGDELLVLGTGRNDKDRQSYWF